MAMAKTFDKQATVSIYNRSIKDIQQMILFLYLKGAKAVPVDISITKSSSEWAVFAPNDDLLQTFTLPQAKQRGFNKNTISKPVRKSFIFYSNEIFLL